MPGLVIVAVAHNQKERTRRNGGSEIENKMNKKKSITSVRPENIGKMVKHHMNAESYLALGIGPDVMD